jgi:hypothetical protein
VIPIKLREWEAEMLRPYCERNVTGLTTFTPDDLIGKINAVPDTAREKVLLVHYWNRLCLALSQQNSEAISGWLVALALATHTASFLLPKASGKLKQEKTAKRIQPVGTIANKTKGDEHLAELHANIINHINSNPHALDKSATVCRNALRAKGLLCGYADSTALAEIKVLFAKRRREAKTKA